MTDVPVDVVLVATFSHQLVASTVTAANFFLGSGQTNIAGTVQCSGNQASFTPSNPLPYGILCTATITTGIQGIDAKVAGADYTWSFTIEAAPIVRNWGIPERIKSHSGHGRYPEIAMDGLGNAIVVWDEEASGTHHVWTNRYEAGQGWTGAQKIVENAEPIQYPHVAANDSGMTVTVGPYHDGLDDYRLWTRRYVPGTGWEDIEIIGPDTGSALYPRVRMYGTGGALAVWQQFNGTDYEVLSNRYMHDAGWLGVVRVSADGVEAKSPCLDMNDAGVSLAAWEQSGAQDVGIWTSRHTMSAGWSTPIRIESIMIPSPAGGRPRLSTSSRAFPRTHPSPSGPGATRLRFTTGPAFSPSIIPMGWGLPVEIAVPGVAEHAIAPRIAIDSNGNAIAVWYQLDAIDSTYHIWANVYN